MHEHEVAFALAREYSLDPEIIRKMNTFDRRLMMGWKYVEYKRKPGEVKDVNAFTAKLFGMLAK